MNYQKIYDMLIERGKNRVITEYTECHHILPRCMGGTDEHDNLVDLTPEEHYLCHQLLVKIHPDNIGLVRAAMFMTSAPDKRRISNKTYGWLRRRLSEYMKGPNNPGKNQPKGEDHWKFGKAFDTSCFTEQGLQNMSETKLGEKNPMYGVKPWKHGRATEYTKSIWSNADKIYEVWLQNDRPSYCRLHSLIRGKMYDSKTIGPFMNMVKYFRSGWIPTQDPEWNKE